MFKSGETIGPYTLIRQLGQGGFGVVWLAEKHSPIITTEFAIKLALDPNPNLELIKQEADLWKQAAGHPNVLPMIEANVYEGYVVLVSEYVPDGSLQDYLDRQRNTPLSIDKAVEIITGVLAGLRHLHDKKIIHRDLKPANILLQNEVPKLTDFGIARVLKTSDFSKTIMGTPPYMAPEAFRGMRSEQTDIWSVGVIFYQLITGHLPFFQDDLFELIQIIALNDPDPLPSSIPIQIEKIVYKALEKDTSQRYKSVEAMGTALRYITRFPSDEKIYDLESTIIPSLGDNGNNIDKIEHSESKPPKAISQRIEPSISLIIPKPEQLHEVPLTSNKTSNGITKQIWKRLFRSIIGLASILIISFVIAVNINKEVDAPNNNSNDLQHSDAKPTDSPTSSIDVSPNAPISPVELPQSKRSSQPSKTQSSASKTRAKRRSTDERTQSAMSKKTPEKRKSSNRPYPKMVDPSEASVSSRNANRRVRRSGNSNFFKVFQKIFKDN